ncbi:hypothetical protein C4B63_22g95 [Trypanosoma cruzi]|uniref:Treble clef zinc finger domain-containing protein n=1 Tax=Trypanosoma cruzi TaxID=5693 RepID=A0A2V2VGE2_TRYCR|nr:hypothetical protein C4B63_22g95 [Trypanosoma cruzi]
MLRYRTGGVGGLPIHYVSTWWHLARHYPHRVACMLALHHGHTVRRVSTSHVASSEGGRNIGKREPQLRRLAVVRPDLVDEWVPELNDADVSSVPCTSQMSVWWRCTACGENYQASVRDRAVADKGCPRCSLLHQPQSPQHTNGSENGAVGDAKTSSGGLPSLAETHPLLASRWDYEKNGLLRPTDVTSTSELNVWWRPAEGRPAHEPSFRRPVYAFVEVPYSKEEQKESLAKMELDILQQVRQAAKIAEARELDTFPAAATMLDDIVSNSPEYAASMPMTREKQGQELEGEDLYKAIELWERGVDAKSDAAYQPLFQFTEACDWGEVSREEVLTVYDQFVMGHKLHKKAKEGTNADANNSVESFSVPSVITDPDWVQHFTLSVDDVSKDCFASSARLVLPDVLFSLKSPRPQEGGKSEEKKDEATVISRRVDTLPPPPEEYETEIRTSFAPRKRFYPRPPPMPPSCEDDLADSVAMATEETRHQATSHEGKTENGKRGSLSRNAPSEASFEVLSLADSQSLLREYALSGDKALPFDADEKDLQKQSLVGPVAVQSMTREDAQALQYNRGAPRPRRTVRFRLRPPVDADIRQARGLGTALGESLSSTANKAEARAQPVIQAPGVPRKVARPKKKRQETTDINDSSSSPSHTEENTNSAAFV